MTTRTKRPVPRMGDALVVNYDEAASPVIGMTMVMAECECGQKVYTAVSGSPEAARRIIYRKHVKHLATCARQAELFALDEADGWWTWTSPNGIRHAVPGDRPCATCGNHHERGE